MAGTGIYNAIIATQVLVWAGDLWANAVAGDTVGIVGLVNYTGGAAWAKDIAACL